MFVYGNARILICSALARNRLTTKEVAHRAEALGDAYKREFVPGHEDRRRDLDKETERGGK